MSEDTRIMLVSNYLKQPVPSFYRDNYVKDHVLRFTYLRFMLNSNTKFIITHSL